MPSIAKHVNFVVRCGKFALSMPIIDKQQIKHLRVFLKFIAFLFT